MPSFTDHQPDRLHFGPQYTYQPHFQPQLHNLTQPRYNPKYTYETNLVQNQINHKNHPGQEGSHFTTTQHMNKQFSALSRHMQNMHIKLNQIIWLPECQ